MELRVNGVDDSLPASRATTDAVAGAKLR